LKARSNVKALRNKWLLGTAAAVVVIAAGAPLAAWLVGGSGSAGAKVDVAQNLTAAPAEATSALHPGATGDLAFTVTNLNPFAVRVTGATFGAASGCSSPAVTVTGDVPETVVAASGGIATINVDVAMGNSSDDCQGKQITIPVVSIAAESTAS
jgi:hypothetical protein